MVAMIWFSIKAIHIRTEINSINSPACNFNFFQHVFVNDLQVFKFCNPFCYSTLICDNNNFSKYSHWLLALSGIACCIKITLQLFSVIPYLSKLAFGFRPVVIGYLHLMFLGVISIFIIGFCKMNQFIFVNRTVSAGIIIFVSGIILNEFFLLIQGLSYMNYISVPFINELLLGAAICMLCGVSILIVGLRKGIT